MMELFFSAASPFVRKVLIVAHECGVGEHVRLLDSAAHPVERDARIKAFNPLAKVPAARMADGETLFDSRVIAERIAADHDPQRRIFPEGSARWTALRRQALADGLCDAALLVRYERMARPEARRWDLWVERQLAKIDDALDAMATDLPAPGVWDIGAISYACALGYLDFRFSGRPWRPGRAALDDWCAGELARPSMIATAPR
jgi:glutathione S-transferase